MPRIVTTEDRRLEEARTRKKHWKRWGPYLSERQWGTVREDYSPGGTAWEFFPHDHARSRAYRWGEDGIGGISDRHQMMCFGLALWNGRDPILKERMFGLTGNEGNHGEDVKEYYFYLDATPIFAENRYFDIYAEYAKADVEDILIKITAVNRGPEAASLHLLPSFWFRNTWSWGRDLRRPDACVATSVPESVCAELQHWQYGKRWLICAGQPELLFTENETNNARILGERNRSPYVKDAFHEYIIHGNRAAVNPQKTGTKMAAYYPVELGPGQSVTLKLRLTDVEPLAGMERELGLVGIITSRLAHSQRIIERCQSRDAPVPLGNALVQAVLSLRCAHLARRRPRGPAAAQGALERA